MTSYFLPVFTNQFVVTDGPGLSVVGQLQRQKQGLDVLEGKMQRKEMQKIFKKYQIQYILFRTDRLDEKYLIQFKKSDDFGLIYQEHPYFIYKVN